MDNANLLCDKYGIVEPYYKGNTLIFYEWEEIDSLGTRRYWKQEIDIPTMTFGKRTSMKSTKFYAQHI